MSIEEFWGGIHLVHAPDADAAKEMVAGSRLERGTDQ